jgi:hypothetical protein
VRLAPATCSAPCWTLATAPVRAARVCAGLEGLRGSGLLVLRRLHGFGRSWGGRVIRSALRRLCQILSTLPIPPMRLRRRGGRRNKAALDAL